MQLILEGEQAITDHDLDRALGLFRQAKTLENQLDPAMRDRLDGHLQMLSPMTPEPLATPPGSLIDQSTADVQVIARKLASDVSQAQSEAKQLQTRDPEQALAKLQQARQQVADSTVDSNTRELLQRRLDVSIREVEQYINEHRSELDLNAQNQSVQEENERRKVNRIETQQKIADMVEQYNKLRDEYRFEEMVVIAKRARELAPNEPIVMQLWEEAKFISRNYKNEQLKSDSEESFWTTIYDAQRSSISPINDEHPVKFPEDPVEWGQLTEKRRAALLRDKQSRLNDRELEIKSKLRTTVPIVDFDNRPLSEVTDYLSRLVGINIHLDEGGLAEEGIETNHPVNLHLNNEISLESVLNLILRPLHLAFVIDNEVLMITSEQLRNGVVYTVTYPVADLVIPIPNFTPGSNYGLQGAINDAYAAMGYSGLGNQPKQVILANNDGASSSGMINPQVLAQIPGAIPPPPGLSGVISPLSGGSQPISTRPGGLGRARQRRLRFAYRSDHHDSRSHLVGNKRRERHDQRISHESQPRHQPDGRSP